MAELPTFLWSVGSNFRLRGKTLQLEAQKGWHALRQRQNCSDWLQLLNKIRTDLRSSLR
jgi:hypothetical protein